MTSARFARLKPRPYEPLRIKRFIGFTRYTNKNGHCERRQLNVRSARYVETQVTRTRSRKTSAFRGLRIFTIGVAFGGACQDLLGDQAGVLADRHFDLGGHIRVGLEESLGVFPSLPQP